MKTTRSPFSSISHTLPTHTQGTTVKNNRWVIFNILDPIKASQQQANTYLKFTTEITSSHIYNGTAEVKPSTLNILIRLPMYASGLYNLLREDILDAALEIQTLRGEMGNYPNLLKIQETRSRFWRFIFGHWPRFFLILALLRYHYWCKY